ncbi:hypothetical protein RND71_043611 [Anisodus tanguticus]|uniref:4-nitrophenylphosphatase n=1 Tax=Anisodus tanguticus TaxID=243964 RepID=A0AAE1QPF9_9SOLA|nr:hypothetical protein RND71_043611 [Anisodus tanguticus]
MNDLKKLNPVNLNNKERVKEFLERYDYILCDCDGVLWLSNNAVPGVAKTLNRLRELGKKIIFATNNSTKTREEFMNKLRRLGYIAYMDELFPTSYSTAVYLNSIGFDGQAYVIGCSGISKELAKFGIESEGVGLEPTPDDWIPGYADIEDYNYEINAVIVGFDNQISFPKLVKACSYVKKPNCKFIAANADETFPPPNDKVMVPGPGAYIAAIEAVTKKKAINMGKPYKFFFECIKHVHKDIDNKRTIMIGDRLTTDMVFGRNNGISTLFVQSGLGTYEEMINYKNSNKPEDRVCVPDYYLPNKTTEKDEGKFLERTGEKILEKDKEKNLKKEEENNSKDDSDFAK